MRKQLKNENKTKSREKNESTLTLDANIKGDESNKLEFTKADLDSLILLDNNVAINTDLVDNKVTFSQEGNIYALYAEDVLKNQLTGANLGIYDYDELDKLFGNTRLKQIHNYKPEKIGDIKSEKNLNELQSTSLWAEEEYGFDKCVLAEGNSLDDGVSNVVITFKGYLEVSKKEFSVIRRCNLDGSKITEVFIPAEFISKYKLRNGDEIICTCKECDGRMLLGSLLSINQIPYYDWNCDRPLFNDLLCSKKIKKIQCNGEYIEPIVSKFGLYKGDNTLVYINKNTPKTQMLNKFICELSEAYDKVIYINPCYKSNVELPDNQNIVKFCSHFNEKVNTQITIALLGANYARRLIELGNDVAIVIDDIDAIVSLDYQNVEELPLCKTILNSAKSTTKGSVSIYTLISLRSNSIDSFVPYAIFKSVETLGIVIDNNEVDLYNCYRI